MGVPVLAITAAAALAAAGCESASPMPPGDARFGQVGEVTAVLEVPLLYGDTTGERVERRGTLEQVVRWGSALPWRFTERISYRRPAGCDAGVPCLGDENTTPSPTSPVRDAADYDAWIVQLNERDDLTPFGDLVPPMAGLECELTQTRVTLRIEDHRRGETQEWIRCAHGTLQALTPADAGPDLAASRVIQAVALLRDRTVGDMASDFLGSVPFATLHRASDSRVPLLSSRVLYSDDEWLRFWQEYVGSLQSLPAVDFRRELVLVGSVGRVEEAGDTVEIRRVLPVSHGTSVELWHRIPGDFCTPAERVHHPFHAVVLPRAQVPDPVRFNDEIERQFDCA